MENKLLLLLLLLLLPPPTTVLNLKPRILPTWHSERVGGSGTPVLAALRWHVPTHWNHAQQKSSQPNPSRVHWERSLTQAVQGASGWLMGPMTTQTAGDPPSWPLISADSETSRSLPCPRLINLPLFYLLLIGLLYRFSSPATSEYRQNLWAGLAGTAQLTRP